MQFECKFMEKAIALAKKGRGRVSPNPMVGAIIVKNDNIIGEGYHESFGEAHAERNAIANCTESPKGADLYVTLEPCCHFGKTPPCTRAIIEAGISRVFIGSADHNPLVAGKGVMELRANGIIVKESVCIEECDKLNEVFFHYIKTKRPFVTLKYAMSVDGKIATYKGESKWISGEKSRNKVQETRSLVGSIMVGIGTALQDDPLLNCRISGGNQPLRIICDSKLRLPLHSRLVKTAVEFPTIVAAVSGSSDKEKALQYASVEILYTPQKSPDNEEVDLLYLMYKLGERGDRKSVV